MILEASSNVTATNIIICVLFMLLSYIIGSIPFGLILGKLICHKDIREYGSKNIGTTNAIRVLGKKVGFTVFFFDVLKGAFVIIILMILNACNVYSSPIEYLWYGAAAIVGHSFSIFLKFKGGKAVATSLGVVLILSPLSAISCLIVFAIFLFATGYVSLGSTFAALTVVTVGWLLHFFGLDATNPLEYMIGKTSLGICILFSLAATLIWLKHIKNYKRLLNGTENSFKKKKKDENNSDNKENVNTEVEKKAS